MERAVKLRRHGGDPAGVEVEDAREVRFIGAVCAAAAAVAYGSNIEGLARGAIGEEIGPLGVERRSKKISYEALGLTPLWPSRAGSVKEGGVVAAEKYSLRNGSTCPLRWWRIGTRHTRPCNERTDGDGTVAHRAPGHRLRYL